MFGIFKMKDKNFTYVNESYGKNFKHGMIVKIGGSCTEQFGSLEYGDSRVYARIMGKVQGPFHPNDVEEFKEQ